MGRYKRLRAGKALRTVGGEAVPSKVPPGNDDAAVEPPRRSSYLSKREIKKLLESDDEVEELKDADSEFITQQTKVAAMNRALSSSKGLAAPQLKSVTNEFRTKSAYAYNGDVSSDISDENDAEDNSVKSDNENVLNVSYKSDVTRNVVKKIIAKSSKTKQKYEYSSEDLAFLERQKEYFRKIDQYELHISE